MCVCFECCVFQRACWRRVFSVQCARCAWQQLAGWTLQQRLQARCSLLPNAQSLLLHNPTHVQRTIVFQNARDGGFMKTFSGRWEVSPFSQVRTAAACLHACTTAAQVLPPAPMHWSPQLHRKAMHGRQHRLDPVLTPCILHSPCTHSFPMLPPYRTPSTASTSRRSSSGGAWAGSTP